MPSAFLTDLSENTNHSKELIDSSISQEGQNGQSTEDTVENINLNITEASNINSGENVNVPVVNGSFVDPTLNIPIAESINLNEDKVQITDENATEADAQQMLADRVGDESYGGFVFKNPNQGRFGRFTEVFKWKQINFATRSGKQQSMTLVRCEIIVKLHCITPCMPITK